MSVLLCNSCIPVWNFLAIWQWQGKFKLYGLITESGCKQDWHYTILPFALFEYYICYQIVGKFGGDNVWKKWMDEENIGEWIEMPKGC